MEAPRSCCASYHWSGPLSYGSASASGAREVVNHRNWDMAGETSVELILKHARVSNGAGKFPCGGAGFDVAEVVHELPVIARSAFPRVEALLVRAALHATELPDI